MDVRKTFDKCQSIIQRNLYYKADTFGAFPSVHLIEGVRLIEVGEVAQCLLTINILRLLCSVISYMLLKNLSRVQIQYLYKTLTDFSTYFKDVIQYYYCQSSPMPERFLTIEISQIQLILVSASA